MKTLRRFSFVLVLCSLFFALSSCKLISNIFPQYKEEAGIYECVAIKINGIDSLSYYEYYNIELKANGDCIVTSKQSGGQSYEANATFEINKGKIFVYTKSGFSTITEEYDYIDGKIIMSTTLNGTTLYAVFERK